MEPLEEFANALRTNLTNTGEASATEVEVIDDTGAWFQLHSPMGDFTINITDTETLEFINGSY